MKKHIIVKIQGMSCVMCARAVERALINIEGIHAVTVDFASGIAKIELEDHISEKIIKNAIETAGYRYLGISPDTAHEDELTTRELFWKKVRFIVGITAGTIAMALMYLPLPDAFPLHYALFALTTPIFLFISYPVFLAAFHALKNRSLTMDVMYSMGIGIAYLSSVMGTFGILPHEFMYYETALFLSAFLMLGRFLEIRAREKTSQAIRALMKLQPTIAHRVTEDCIVDIAHEEIQKGDLLLVKPGEFIPTDGIIISGESAIDQSMLTGESLPVNRGVGDSVIGGCINLEGSFIMQAVRTGNNTALQRIIRIVQEAQISKPAIQKFADRVVGYFIPLILLIAVATFMIWFFFLQSTTSFAIARLISVLVIACPCALGLATPTAVTVGIGRCAALGILIKHSEAFELSEKINTVVFDKTGTLTTGKLEVVAVYTEGVPEVEMIARAAGLQQHSSHPIAQTIVAYALSRGISPMKFESAVTFSGRGIYALQGNYELCAGSARFLNERGYRIPTNLAHRAEIIEERGATAVYFGENYQAIGIFEISSTLRPHAGKAISLLKNTGLSVMMITGDNRRAAQSIAKSLGIDEIIAEVLPEEKAEKIRQLQHEGRTVAFVGDGINDAPSLAVADIGIALSSSTDIALEVGSVVLLSGDLRDVSATLVFGRKVARRIKENIFWAFAYNLLLVPVAAGVLFPFGGIVLKPELAGLAMTLSSVTVVMLSLDLWRFNPRKDWK